MLGFLNLLESEGWICIDEMRHAYKVWLGKPQSLRLLGRCGRERKDKIKLGFKEVLCAVD
jgi:hypothetical protein